MLTINTQYNPMSMQEMMIPVQQANTMHYKAMDDLAGLSEQAGVWEGMLQSDPESNAYKQVSDYQKSIEDQAAQLGSKDISTDVMGNIMKLRRGYTTNIKQIEEAYGRQQEQRKLLEQQRLKDNSLLTSYDTKVPSIDEYIKNKGQTFQHVSKNDITRNVASVASTLATQMRNGQLPEYETAANRAVLQRVIERGLNVDDVTKLRMGQGDVFLQKIVDDAVANSGIQAWGSEQDIAKARMAAIDGMYAGIGKDEVNTMANPYLAHEFSVSMENLRQRNKLAAIDYAKKSEESPAASSGARFQVVSGETKINDKTQTSINEMVEGLKSGRMKLGTNADGNATVSLATMTQDLSENGKKIYANQMNQINTSNLDVMTKGGVDPHDTAVLIAQSRNPEHSKLSYNDKKTVLHDIKKEIEAYKKLSPAEKEQSAISRDFDRARIERVNQRTFGTKSGESEIETKINKELESIPMDVAPLYAAAKLAEHTTQEQIVYLETGRDKDVVASMKKPFTSGSKDACLIPIGGTKRISGKDANDLIDSGSNVTPGFSTVYGVTVSIDGERYKYYGDVKLRNLEASMKRDAERISTITQEDIKKAVPLNPSLIISGDKDEAIFQVMTQGMQSEDETMTFKVPILDQYGNMISSDIEKYSFSKTRGIERVSLNDMANGGETIMKRKIDSARELGKQAYSVFGISETTKESRKEGNIY